MMRTSWLTLLSVPLASLSLAAGPPSPEIRPPDGAVLISESTIEESEAAPEQRGNTVAEHIVAVGGVDRVYRVPEGYRDAVGFFDSQLKRDGVEVVEHKAGSRASRWDVKRSDGTMARVIVRRGRQTEVEIAQAGAAHEEHPIGTVQAPLGDTL